MTEPTAWLIRAGQRSRHARPFADHDVVALGWGDVPGLGDLRTLPAATIRERLLAVPHIASPEQDAAELLAFRGRSPLGDLVVTPDAPAGDVLIGEVTGGYDFQDPSPVGDYRHIRPVRWYGRFDRQLLPVELGRETAWRRTIRRLGHQNQWRSLAARVRDGEGRPLSARGGIDQTRPGPTRPQVARAVRTCGSCGLVKAASQYAVGDDRCVDCR